MNVKERIVEIAKRRGIFWQSASIYNPISGFYDYGPIGFLIKKKFEDIWRSYFLSLSENFYEIETAYIMPKKVFVASGHLKFFSDPILLCGNCKSYEDARTIFEKELSESFEGKSKEEMKEIVRKHGIRCKKCGKLYSEIEDINLMFRIDIGTGMEKREAYMLPETAQGAYLNFKQCYEVLRRKLPMGIAIVGRAYRNEISPRNVLLRMREFRQSELQIFFDPECIDKHEQWNTVEKYKLLLKKCDSDTVEMSCKDVNKELKLPRFYVFYMAVIQKFYLNIIGVKKDSFRFRELNEEERAFYNKIHWDIEIYFKSFKQFKEVAGIHYRTNYDLSGHANVSGTSMEVVLNGKRIVPHVLELSFGIDRNVFMLLDHFLTEEKKRTYLRLPSFLSPYDAAIFPLVNRDGIDKFAIDVKNRLRKCNLNVFYDDSGSIGRRYRRQDEIGTYLCITIDYDSLKKNDCTVRFRDTMKQERVKIDKLPTYIKNKITVKF